MKPKTLPTSFYSRDTVTVAQELLGKVLVRSLRGKLLTGIIVETEAYHEGDPASHSFRGLTPRNAPMFEEPGRAYVYFIYGNHYCLNAVTEKKGKAGAVLIRALEPVEGISTMMKKRGTQETKNLTNGPGKLAEAFAIDRALNRHPLGEPPLYIIGNGGATPSFKTSPRIGITEGSDALLRFYIASNSFVSKHPK